MSWFSILPANVSYIEYWVTRFFLFLGAMAIGPWLLLLVYDVLFYTFRTTTYNIPYIGGRARNRPRPRAPSLNERPNGRARKFSLPVPGIPTTAIEEAVEEKVDGLKRRLEKTEL